MGHFAAPLASYSIMRESDAETPDEVRADCAEMRKKLTRSVLPALGRQNMNLVVVPIRRGLGVGFAL